MSRHPEEPINKKAFVHRKKLCTKAF